MKSKDFYKLKKGDWVRTVKKGIPRKIISTKEIQGRTYVIGLKYIFSGRRGLTYYCSGDSKNFTLLSKKESLLSKLKKCLTSRLQ